MAVPLISPGYLNEVAQVRAQREAQAKEQAWRSGENTKQLLMQTLLAPVVQGLSNSVDTWLKSKLIYGPQEQRELAQSGGTPETERFDTDALAAAAKSLESGWMTPARHEAMGTFAPPQEQITEVRTEEAPFVAPPARREEEHGARRPAARTQLPSTVAGAGIGVRVQSREGPSSPPPPDEAVTRRGQQVPVVWPLARPRQPIEGTMSSEAARQPRAVAEQLVRAGQLGAETPPVEVPVGLDAAGQRVSRRVYAPVTGLTALGRVAEGANVKALQEEGARKSRELHQTVQEALGQAKGTRETMAQADEFNRLTERFVGGADSLFAVYASGAPKKMPLTAAEQKALIAQGTPLIAYVRASWIRRNFPDVKLDSTAQYALSLGVDYPVAVPANEVLLDLLAKARVDALKNRAAGAARIGLAPLSEREPPEPGYPPIGEVAVSAMSGGKRVSSRITYNAVDLNAAMVAVGKSHPNTTAAADLGAAIQAAATGDLPGAKQLLARANVATLGAAMRVVRESATSRRGASAALVAGRQPETETDEQRRAREAAEAKAKADAQAKEKSRSAVAANVRRYEGELARANQVADQRTRTDMAIYDGLVKAREKALKRVADMDAKAGAWRTKAARSANPEERARAEASLNALEAARAAVPDVPQRPDTVAARQRYRDDHLTTVLKSVEGAATEAGKSGADTAPLDSLGARIRNVLGTETPPGPASPAPPRPVPAPAGRRGPDEGKAEMRDVWQQLQAENWPASKKRRAFKSWLAARGIPLGA